MNNTINTTMDRSKWSKIKVSIPTIEYTEREWDTICELLKSEFGYTTRAECRKHLQNEVQTYAEHLADRWSEHHEDYGSLNTITTIN